MYQKRMREFVGGDKTKTSEMNIDLNLQCNTYISLLPMNANCDKFLSSLLLTHVFITTFTGHEGHASLKWSS